MYGQVSALWQLPVHLRTSEVKCHCQASQSLYFTFIFIQGKPRQGEKYLQNTYYVSGIMLGTLRLI